MFEILFYNGGFCLCQTLTWGTIIHKLCAFSQISLHIILRTSFFFKFPVFSLPVQAPIQLVKSLATLIQSEWPKILLSILLTGRICSHQGPIGSHLDGAEVQQVNIFSLHQLIKLTHLRTRSELSHTVTCYYGTQYKDIDGNWGINSGPIEVIGMEFGPCVCVTYVCIPEWHSPSVTQWIQIVYCCHITGIGEVAILRTIDLNGYC